jgi:outer membrane protein assembly factor BamB
MKKTTIMSVVCVMMCVVNVWGADWPNYRGVKYDGISQETGWKVWKQSGPKVLWTAELGTGFATMTVKDGCMYSMGNKEINGKEQDVVWCLDALTGQEKWSHAYEEPLAAKNFEGGPCATPTIHDGRVYTLSRSGKVFCLNAENGDVIWQEDVAKTYGIKIPRWGLSSSPMILDGIVYLNVGGTGMALKAEDKSLVWTNGKTDAGYASMVPYELNGKTHMLTFTGKEFAGVDPKTGAVAFSEPWKTQYAINAADPILLDDGRIFISSGYGYGCALLEIKDGAVKQVYKNKNMKNQCYGTVLLNGYVYGFNGQVNGGGALTCLDVKTGEAAWTQKSKELGTGTVLLAGDRLIVLGEKGALFVVKASPDGYQEIASAKILNKKCWTPPALANGLLYARDAFGKLVCLDLR